MPERPAIIDADGHIFERDVDIRKYLEPPWDRRRSPLAPQDQPFDLELFGTLGYPEYPLGGMSPEEQVAVWHRAMDQAGVERAILFPTFCGNVAKLIEPEFRRAVIRACNNHFAAEYNARSDRIRVVGVLPMRQPEEAAQELRRAVAELGLISFEITSIGLPFGLGDPFYDPVYAAAEQLGVPLCIHAGRFPAAEFSGDRFSTFSEVHSFVFPAGVMMHLTSVLWHGVPVRFPRLRLGFLEGGASWLPFQLDRLDEHWEKRGEREAPYLTKKPSQVFRESQLYLSFEAGETLLGATVDHAGDDHFLYASDYPHWDAEFPMSIDHLWKRPDLSTASKEKLLRHNARTFFGV